MSEEGKLTYIFGFGGNKKEHLFDQLKENLYINAQLLDNQDIANVVVSKNVKYFPFVLVYKVRMSGDVIEWTEGSLPNTRSEIIKKKNKEIFIGTVSNETVDFRIKRINESSNCENREMNSYKNISDVAVDDVVYYATDKDYGIAAEVKERGVIVEFYNENGVLWRRSMIKVEYLSKIECKE